MAKESQIIVSAGGTLLGRKKPRYSKERIRENLQLYAIMLPVLVLIFIFCYIPMYGLVIAFQDYNPGNPFIAFDGSVKWVGLTHFITFAKSIYFFRLIKNTLLLSFYNLIFGFWVPIAFALLLNEVLNMHFKKLVQTASYMPYFISSVVVAGMVLSFIQTDGIVNSVFAIFGKAPVAYNTSASAFPVIYTLTNVWKSFGFNSILYLSSISSVDPSLYESARIDGANRLKQCMYITLPSILPTISIMLIFTVGSMLSSNSDLILLLYNSATYSTADVIDTYIYRIGIEGGQFSYTAAIGLFSTAINFILVFVANKISNKLTNYGLW